MSASRNVRKGVTLTEIVVSVAILAILGVTVVLSVEASSRSSGEARRIATAARVLDQLRDAAVRYNFGDPSAVGLNTRGINGDTSFTSKISGIGNLRGGINPGRLSQLTNKISAADLNSCGGAFTTSANWTQNFFTQPIAVGGTFKIADGFIANDQLVRYNPAGAVTNLAPTSSVQGAGTLAIVIPNVALSDAQALAALMEGDQPTPLGSGNFAVVRFTPSGNAPVTVSYHMVIHGC
jgi:prepilin-type N-terminal cleavage/methylation domain-containing protein